MKILIVVAYVPRYSKGHEKNFAPPITGIHLAALVPPDHEVEVVYQQTDPVPFDSDADLVGISFFSGFAREAYRIAREFKQRGKCVVLGGPHVTFWVEEALRVCDCVVTGEAESVWPEVIRDAEKGSLAKVYSGRPTDLQGMPTPRYDLLSKSFFVRRVVQATRGCPFNCSFCSVPSLNPGFRKRPIDEVLRDIDYNDFPHWWQRKIVWFWDDNLTADRAYVKDLLRQMIPRKKWWLTQASIDIVKDAELLDLMERSGCIGIFLGIESFSPSSLRDANKPQNRVEQYQEAVAILHDRGTAVLAGVVSGFDHDTYDSIVGMADRLNEIGVDVPFLSILTPYAGSDLHAQFRAEGRFLKDRGWDHYNGYNVAFRPNNLSPQELLAAHRELWSKAFSPKNSLDRIRRSLGDLRAGAAMMSATMNLFYGLKAARGNMPRDASLTPEVSSGIQESRAGVFRDRTKAAEVG